MTPGGARAKADWSRCPQCRQQTLAFTNHYAVLTRATKPIRTGTDPHDGKDRLRYEPAWVCQNPRACLLTDRASVILNANRAASVLLNVSAIHLKGRELLVFSQDRETFRALLQELDRNHGMELRARLQAADATPSLETLPAHHDLARLPDASMGASGPASLRRADERTESRSGLD